jgi:hypothetical protein
MGLEDEREGKIRDRCDGFRTEGEGLAKDNRGPGYQKNARYWILYLTLAGKQY